MKIKTGFGYITDAEGKFISKYELPMGEHPLKEGYSYVELSEEDFNTFSIPQDILVVKDAKLQQTKQISSQKINLILSDIKQRNSLYTLYQYSKRVKSSLTAEEKTEIADLESKWTQIEAIRTASNQIEAEVNNLQTVEEVQAYNIKDHKVWLT